MKVLEILKLCNGMADLQLPERYFAEQSDALADERITKLVYCCNSLLEQLYCDYATALKKCTLVATDGFADTFRPRFQPSGFPCGFKRQQRALPLHQRRFERCRRHLHPYLRFVASTCRVDGGSGNAFATHYASHFCLRLPCGVLFFRRRRWSVVVVE